MQMRIKHIRQYCIFLPLPRPIAALHPQWAEENCAGIFKQSTGARNRVGIGLSYRPVRIHRLAELIPWNRFLGLPKS